MLILSTLDDIAALRETVDVECKLAAGPNGQGKLPDDLWETYSAFANTQGGVIVLGLREKQGTFSMHGIAQPDRLVTDLFNCLNNPQKVSTNLLADDHVRTIAIDGKTLLVIDVPRASRKQRPVYLNGNPMRNTFLRLQEGDRRCNGETVKRMLAEQVEDSRDTRILRNFGHDDIDWESLQEAVPNYFVDYQEQALPNTVQRWTDRLVPDGTWSGNVFDFYRRVYRKLVADLKVPFVLENGIRRDDTPIHKAVREALVNTLVHADYSGRSSVRVIKQPDMFSFRNPGNMRVPVEQALQGGESDCRNRTLHQLFLMIGIGERAGSGIPTILHGWKQGNWRPPVLLEKDEPEQTVLELRMLDLLPGPVLDLLHRLFGDEFVGSSDLQKLILATAFIESVVSHARIKEITVVHPYDLSKALQELVRKGFLESVGRGRNTQYHLHGFAFPSPDDVFAGSSGDLTGSSEHLASSSGDLASSSEHLASSSEHLASSSEHLTSSSEHIDTIQRDDKGRRLSKHLQYPAVDDTALLDKAFYSQLMVVASEPRTSRRMNQDTMQHIILALCHEQYVTLQALAQLVARSPDALRQQYLSPMVKEGLLKLAFPQTPTHEKQAYIAAR